MQGDETLPAPPARPSAFAVGSQIAGRYRIVRSLGVGGVGEVFEVEDLIVGSRVALKVLRADRTTSTMIDRLRRELALARKITHRNVCRIHDLGEHDGRVFLTMELLEGETLADRIRRGPMPLDLVRTIVEQLVAGLAAAHAASVVHRDFKSSNVIVVGNEPRVVVTDFGLARSDVAGEHTDLTGDTTMLGTAAYMAPEQVEGRPATTASDIYALGVVMFECVTGTVPFRGDTPLATASARLTESAPSARARRPELPPAWEATIARCLEREPHERFARVEDVALALRGRVRGRRRLAFATAALALTGAVGGVIGYALNSSRSEQRAGSDTTKRVDGRGPRQLHKLTARSGIVHSARFAADGKTVVYTAAWNGEPTAIYTTQPGVATSRQLLANAELAAVSRSGELAVLVKPRRVFELLVGTLARTHLQGGSPREIATDVLAADFAPDGELVIARYDNPGSTNQSKSRIRIEWPIGKPVLDMPSLGAVALRVAPDGQHVAVLTRKKGRATVLVVDRSRRVIEVPADESSTLGGLAWQPDGTEIWTVSTSEEGSSCVDAHRLDNTKRRIYCGTGQLTIHDVTADERALITSTTEHGAIRVQMPDETHERELKWHDDSRLYDITPDGRRLLLGGATGAIYMHEAAADEPVLVTTGLLSFISPDGKWLVTSRGPDGQRRHFLVPVGAGQERELTAPGVNRMGIANMGWAADSAHVYTHCNTATETDTCVFDLDGHGRILLHNIRPSQTRPLSPDGRWMFATDGSTSFGLAALDGSEVRPLPDSDAIRSIGHGGYGDTIGWARDGRGVFAWRDTSQPAAAIEIDRIDLTTGVATPWKRLAPEDKTGEVWFTRALVLGDGDGYAYSFVRALSDLYLLD